MAIVTRYFSTAAAGDGDGTSWANRAALLDGSSYYSTLITGFDFTSNSLICRIGPGTYTPLQNFTSALFSVNTPTAVSTLIFHGCDSSGNLLTPVKPSWQSAEPAWSATGIPVISFGSSYYGNLAYTIFNHLNITGSRAGYIYASLYSALWCQFSTTSSSTSGYICSTLSNGIINCVFSSEGASAFMCLVQNDGLLYNCRFIGPGSSSGSGNRDGIYSTVGYEQYRCTFIGLGGNGINIAAANATRLTKISGCTIANCGGAGINLTNSASPVTAYSGISNCMITGCAYGVNANSQMSALVKDCRLRDNTSGNLANMGNWPTDLNNYVTDSDDATEYVDTATGDYRIDKAATNVWNKGYGAGDEVITSSTGGGIWMPRARQIGV